MKSTSWVPSGVRLHPIIQNLVRDNLIVNAEFPLEIRCGTVHVHNPTLAEFIQKLEKLLALVFVHVHLLT